MPWTIQTFASQHWNKNFRWDLLFFVSVEFILSKTKWINLNGLHNTRKSNVDGILVFGNWIRFELFGRKSFCWIEIKLKLNISQTFQCCAKKFRFFFLKSKYRLLRYLIPLELEKSACGNINIRPVFVYSLSLRIVCLQRIRNVKRIAIYCQIFTILTKTYSILTDMVNHLKRHSIVHNALPTIFCRAPNFYVN